MQVARLSRSLRALLLVAGGLLPAGAGGQANNAGLDFKLDQASDSLNFGFKLDLGDVQQALGELPPSLCGTYATVANYSAIWADPRMRAALEDAHARGGDDDAHDDPAALGRVLEACGHAVGQFANNTAINAHCGNLTTVAHDEAAKNFSRGIVADRLVAGGPAPDSEADSAASAALAPWGCWAGVGLLVSLGMELL